MARQILTGAAPTGSRASGGELEGFQLPSLLSASPEPGPDPERLLDQLDLAFLGRASAGEIDNELDTMVVGSSRWNSEYFRNDLFLAELIRRCFDPGSQKLRVPVHRRFLARVLCHPPSDLADVRHRQGILREIEGSPAVASSVSRLFSDIQDLLARLRAARDDARLKPIHFRFGVLGAFRAAVTRMAEDFADARSGLHRLHEAAEELRESHAFQIMEALLDHHASMATLDLQVVIGSNGRLRHLEIRGLKERTKNPFYRRPLRRWWDRLRMLYRRYQYDPDELVDRLMQGVYQQVAPAIARIIQLLCHLEVFLASRSFAADARNRGLEVCLPEVERGVRLRLVGLFNPLLMPLMERPVPSDLTMDTPTPVVVVTGPNSGGKTRVLQAIGLAQVLGQSGLYTPCARGTLPLATGLFASIVEVDRADQAEGRLGTELVRLRALFETVPPGSLVLLDELCSGTNPSEALEIVDMVLRLLRQLKPVAFVTTHFLDFAQQLQREQTQDGLTFLQAEVDSERGATFRFIPGVASTSLAVGTARRLGVTFSELERTLEKRLNGEERMPPPSRGDLPKV